MRLSSVFKFILLFEIAFYQTIYSSSPKFAIATVDPISTSAGAKTLMNGGNAFDAAVAAALTLGVVNGYNSGIGGGCFIIGRKSNGEIFVINGRERAPLKSNEKMFIKNGKPQGNLSKEGSLSIAVPGALMAYSELSSNHGNIPLRKHLENAAIIADEGFIISERFHERIKTSASRLRKYEGSSDVFLNGDGLAKKKGSQLIQKDLARTYREIAKNGTEWFYKGPFAKKTARWMKQNGGIMDEDDFAKYFITKPKPIKSSYKTHTIIGMPPPSSGGIHVAQILNILENFDLQKIKPNSLEFYHLVAESMKLAFADRAHWLGDPAFAKIPKGLITKNYGKYLSKKINPQRSTNVKSHSTPKDYDVNIFDKHTTHLCCIDNKGNWVAITATINTSFGSKVIIPGTGVLMNNEMDDFSIMPGTQNAFGLVGNISNKIEPGKRPLSSMSPTIVLQDNKPVLTTGAAGGPTIISQTVLNLIRVLEYGIEIDQANMMPRIHHQWIPNLLRVERSVGDKIISSLKLMGHETKIYEKFGSSQAISEIDEKMKATYDLRSGGKSIIHQ